MASSQTGSNSSGERTLITWSRDMPLAWDVTVPDSFAQSHLHNSAIQSCAAADTAADNSDKIRAPGDHSHIFADCSGDRWILERAGYRIRPRFRQAKFLKLPMSLWRHSSFSSACPWRSRGAMQLHTKAHPQLIIFEGSFQQTLI